MFHGSLAKVMWVLVVLILKFDLTPSLHAEPVLAGRGTAAIMSSDAAMLRSLMLEPGFRIDAQIEGEYSFLHLAAMVGDPAIVEALLEAGAEIDAVDGVNGWTPLMHATHQGHEAAARLLLERGANQNVTGTDLSTAAILARYSGLTALFQTADTRTGATPPSDPSRLDDLLLRAVEARDRSLVEALIDQGANPNAISETGWTPLLYAALRHDIETFLLLVNAGAQYWVNGRVWSDGELSFAEAALMGATDSNVSIQEVLSFLTFLKDYNLIADASRSRRLAQNLDLQSSIVEFQFFRWPSAFQHRPTLPGEFGEEISAARVTLSIDRTGWRPMGDSLRSTQSVNVAVDRPFPAACLMTIRTYMENPSDRASIIDLVDIDVARAYVVRVDDNPNIDLFIRSRTAEGFSRRIETNIEEAFHDDLSRFLNIEGAVWNVLDSGFQWAVDAEVQRYPIHHLPHQNFDEWLRVFGLWVSYCERRETEAQ